MKNMFLTDRFFLIFGILVVLFATAFAFPPLLIITKIFLLIAIIVCFIDGINVFSKDVNFECERVVPKVFSLGDENKVTLKLKSKSSKDLSVSIIDELPFQFQKRDFELQLKTDPKEEVSKSYFVKPLERGSYAFGDIQIFVETNLHLIKRKITIEASKEVPVFPSIVQMKKYELMALSSIATSEGLKKMRRIGHSYEFEQIKNYVPGDDYRSVNWKASSRRAQLMVNQYEDERSQQVYCIIDKSRNMRMPFEGLSLMDYAINTSLVISNVVLQKHDKAGLISFSDKIGATIKADRRPAQLNKIINALYREQPRDLESNFEILYHSARKLIKGRSLLILFTNFESLQAAERMLPLLRKVNNIHLLVVVFFVNTEIEDFTKSEVTTTEEIYHQVIAKKFLNEKEQIVQKYKQYGIQSILTRPEDLSINTINKYLELKARGLI